ncbi:DUF1876 domain-containing protein [Lolliginicoccus suaedae]|uniref:DUF1876 domain-containing protein n=1 Tax=Lolliginicoccus suaedae TaxID=2605429 RepID=UPI0011F03A71|nr:DUF1876 domain-containing protein [Lolliginicoccus suaedae]
MQDKRWWIDIKIDERGSQTRAEARLHANGELRLSATGMARRNPDDPDVPKIGDELAVARALQDIAHRLVEISASDIESVTHKPVHLDA